MKSEEWKSYRTRFLVNAKQLNSSLSFVDQLGRQHCGRKGDYLVESSDGVLSITPRRIFEDIYVPMLPPQEAYKFDKTPATESMTTETSMREAATTDAMANRTAADGAMSEGTVSDGKMTNGQRMRTMTSDGINLQNFQSLDIQALEIQKIRLRKSSTGRQPTNQAQATQPNTVRTPRKLPQPCRGRNPSASLGLM
jgi:hypothetical protein